MTIYNKLIRDKIPEMLDTKGVTYTVHVAEETEYREKLFEKLQEEITEFLEAKNIEELADVHEVLNAIQTYLSFSDELLRNTRDKKNEERGAFEKRIILEETQ